MAFKMNPALKAYGKSAGSNRVMKMNKPMKMDPSAMKEDKELGYKEKEDKKLLAELKKDRDLSAESVSSDNSKKKIADVKLAYNRESNREVNRMSRKEVNKAIKSIKNSTDSKKVPSRLSSKNKKKKYLMAKGMQGFDSFQADITGGKKRESGSTNNKN